MSSSTIIVMDAIAAVIFVIFMLGLALAREDSTRCVQSCGVGKSAIQIGFPFGFSENCKIRLNCTDTGIQIGEFQFQNVTSNSLFLNIPAMCNRRIDSIKPLFDQNYGLIWRNSLLLQNCSSQANLSGCMISTAMVENRVNLQGCDLKSDNISCYSGEKRGESELLSYENVIGTGCQFLFSSISANSGVSFELNRIELSWWLNGRCNCSSNANCSELLLAHGGHGFRCRCNDGFVGDGFADGEGCRQIKDCRASNYISGHCVRTVKIGLLLIGGIILGAALMAVLAVLCIFIRRKSHLLKTRISTKHLISDAAGNYTVPFYPYKEIERATNGFSDDQRLGTGAYGTVYAGNLYNNECVAIKRIKNRGPDSVDQVMNEIKLLSSVSHPNLVRLLGCCIEKGEQILVYEFMANGTLSQHLTREKGRGLPWTIRLRIASETAQAIAHLHSAISPPIYHRDIKSTNILLDRNFNSKVADFGLSRLGMTEMSLSHISTAPQGTPGYLDPQYHQDFHLSDKSDVYSFGVVLVEIITALKVVDFSRAHSEVNLAALAVDRIGRGFTDEIIDPVLDPNRDAWTLSSIHKVAELAFRCLAFHKDMRPSMLEVAEELEQIRLSSWAPMDELSCMGSSVASSCSLPLDETDKKTIIGSRRLIFPNILTDLTLTQQKVKDNSPVSMHDPWLSQQSSPSTNSLLGNIIH